MEIVISEYPNGGAVVRDSLGGIREFDNVDLARAYANGLVHGYSAASAKLGKASWSFAERNS